jgi:protein-tyrosine phosphatase
MASRPADEIIPGLFIGSRHMILDNYDWLANERIDIVISALTDEEYAEYMISHADFVGRTWYPLVIDDSPLENIYVHFDSVHLIIRKALSEGRRVLVHCAAGVSRSVTLVAAYLIAEKQITAAAALALILKRRERANPNTGFIRQLRLLERMVCRNSPTRTIIN